jgi:hypothetical protein
MGLHCELYTIRFEPRRWIMTANFKCLVAAIGRLEIAVQNREEMLAKMETNQERMEAKMETNKGKITAKLDAHHERMIAKMDAWIEGMEACVGNWRPVQKSQML